MPPLANSTVRLIYPLPLSPLPVVCIFCWWQWLIIQFCCCCCCCCGPSGSTNSTNNHQSIAYSTWHCCFKLSLFPFKLIWSSAMVLCSVQKKQRTEQEGSVLAGVSQLDPEPLHCSKFQQGSVWCSGLHHLLAQTRFPTVFSAQFFNSRKCHYQPVPNEQRRVLVLNCWNRLICHLLSTLQKHNISFTGFSSSERIIQNGQKKSCPRQWSMQMALSKAHFVKCSLLFHYHQHRQWPPPFAVMFLKYFWLLESNWNAKQTYKWLHL